MRRLVMVVMLLLLADAAAALAPAERQAQVLRVLNEQLAPILPANGAGGAAVAVRIEGETLFFDFGFADLAARAPITSDSLFNLASLRKLFEVTLLAQAVRQRRLALEDPVSRHVTELRHGGYIRDVTLGQLATHTAGISLPSDYKPGPVGRYTLADFIALLNAWQPERGQRPGRQHIYTHAGFVLLQLALERRLGGPIEGLIERQVLEPLRMSSTALGSRGPDGRGVLAPELMPRAVQGYSKEGDPMGAPADQQGHFDIPGSGQMFSSARDMAMLLAASMGELPGRDMLTEALRMTQQGHFIMSSRHTQALAWEINHLGGPIIIDKPGGVDNASAYIGMIPSRQVGIVILGNRGYQEPYEVARDSLLPALARLTGASR